MCGGYRMQSLSMVWVGLGLFDKKAIVSHDSSSNKINLNFIELPLLIFLITYVYLFLLLIHILVPSQ